ncbi:MAG TPA: hypothetical protein VFC46_09410 [Humisphaera sp.]|nr:hypothetical protein [Humisphaera sp.]
MDVAILLFAILLCGVGICLVTRGRWGRRIGDVPHCRKCGYVLTGNTTGRCPECGSLLTPIAVVYGERPRRPRSLLAGVVLLLMGALIVTTVIVTSAMKVDWYRYRPTSWVIQDLDATVPAKRDQAWVELKRRIATGGISTTQEHALIERALHEQQSSARTFWAPDELLDYLGEQYVAHHMDAGEIQRFFDNEMKLRLDVRPTVGPTDPIAYRVMGLGRGPNGWYMRCGQTGYWIDDKKVDTGRSNAEGGFGGISWSSTLSPQSVGKHRLRIDFDLTAVRRGYPIGVLTVAEQSRRIQLTADFAVTQTPPPIVLMTSPDAAAIGRCFSTYGFSKTPDDRLEGMIQCRNPPVPMAFKVFVTVHGKEYPMGSIHFDKATSSGASWGVNSGKLPPGDTGPVDVILRSSEAVAIQTLDMTQIWKGEVIIRGVVVRQPPTTRPGG